MEDTHGAIHVIDDEGNDYAKSRDNFAKEMKSRDCLPILLWNTAAECLYCRVRFVGQFRALELDMKGTEPKDREVLAGKLIETALDPKFRGLVFDPEGVTEDYNWDDFFIGETVLSANVLAGRLPELLLIKSKLVTRAVGFNVEPWGHEVLRLC
jgi:hypothetical protein